jgi:hypothetical protein
MINKSIRRKKPPNKEINSTMLNDGPSTFPGFGKSEKLKMYEIAAGSTR